MTFQTALKPKVALYYSIKSLRNIFLITLLVPFLSPDLFSQDILSDISNFRFFYGHYDTIDHEGRRSNRHKLITDTLMYDPYSYDEIPVLAPGSRSSYRLGNDDVNAQAEKITYTFKVTPESSLFLYQYAIVLEDPGHDPEDQPKFEIIVTENGKIFDDKCGYYKVVAAEDIPGFKTYKGHRNKKDAEVRYKTWTSVGIDLTHLMGRKISIEFSTYDCKRKAHFGYAYLNARHARLELKVKYCPGDDYATITAPEGFNYLWNTGEKSRSIKVDSDELDKDYYCTLTSVTGCEVTLQVEEIIKPKIINASVDISSFKNGFNISCNGANDGFLAVDIKGGVPPYRVIWNDGEVGASRQGLKAGDYQATIFDQMGCEKKIVATLYEPEGVKADIISTDVTCFNGADGTASVKMKSNNLLKYYDMLWSNGATTNQVNNLRKGDHNVKISNKSGCSLLTFKIEEPEPIDAAVQSTNLTCPGGSDGTITVEASGGNAPYTYSLGDRHRQNSPFINNLGAGFYNLTITDQNNCSVNKDIELLEPDPITIKYDSSNYNGYHICCYGDNNGEIFITEINGGNSPYNIRWSDGSTAYNRDALGPGLISLSITDRIGCESLITFDIKEPPKLKLDISPKVFTKPDPFKLLEFRAYGGVPTYTMQLFKNEKLIKTKDGGKLSKLVRGGSQFSALVTDANNCTKQGFKMVPKNSDLRGRTPIAGNYRKGIMKELPCRNPVKQ
ncbi:SprB repeat-containing protein [Fulvivirgaceae bacterium BMA10]|uniref:SprB repeat-containing protein n=1 Tax=Splendidivirga corallicola TaxID=3051826 RepID=A0ABT8KVA1_9BACT|nr:SprB repeat-containing protein [Fulvivirgaceae bacterium BMA10]